MGFNPFPAIGHFIASMFQKLKGEHPDLGPALEHTAEDIIPQVKEAVAAIRAGASRDTYIAIIMSAIEHSAGAWTPGWLTAILAILPPGAFGHVLASAIFVEHLLAEGLQIPMLSDIDTIVQLAYSAWKHARDTEPDAGPAPTAPLDQTTAPSS